jgi:hypothetical protein
MSFVLVNNTHSDKFRKHRSLIQIRNIDIEGENCKGFIENLKSQEN